MQSKNVPVVRDDKTKGLVLGMRRLVNHLTPTATTWVVPHS